MFDDSDGKKLEVDSLCCAECVRMLFDEYDLRLKDKMFFLDGFYEKLKLLETVNEEENESEPDEEDEEELDRELAELDSELEALLAQEEALFEEERDLLCEINGLKSEANERYSKVLRRLDDADQFVTLVESRGARLRMLQTFRVHDDLFSISREGEFPVINTYR